MLNKYLGQVRDNQIIINYLNEIISLHNLDSTIDKSYRTLKPLKKARKKNYHKVIKQARKIVKKDIFYLILKQLEKPKVKQKSTLPDKPLQLKRHILGFCHKYLDEFNSYKTYLSDPEREQELHKARLIIKLLRYTLEEVSDQYNEKLLSHIQLTTKLQHLFGQVHDSDIALKFIRNINPETKSDRKLRNKLITLIRLDRNAKYNVLMNFIGKMEKSVTDNILLEILNNRY